MGRCADVAVAEFAGLRQRWHGFYALFESRVVHAVCDIRAVLDVAAVVEMVRGRWIPDGIQSFAVHVCVYERADPVSGKAFGGEVFLIDIVLNIIFDVACCMLQPVANALVYIVINLAGMYTKYMTDRGQRLAFIETHKAMEHKRESEKEYDRTQKLLDSSEWLMGNGFIKFIYIISIYSSIANVREQRHPQGDVQRKRYESRCPI